MRGRDAGLDLAEKMLIAGPVGDEAISKWKHYESQKITTVRCICTKFEVYIK